MIEISHVQLDNIKNEPCSYSRDSLETSAGERDLSISTLDRHNKIEPETLAKPVIKRRSNTWHFSKTDNSSSLIGQFNREPLNKPKLKQPFSQKLLRIWNDIRLFFQKAIKKKNSVRPDDILHSFEYKENSIAQVTPEKELQINESIGALTDTICQAQVEHRFLATEYLERAYQLQRVLSDKIEHGFLLEGLYSPLL